MSYVVVLRRQSTRTEYKIMKNVKFNRPTLVAARLMITKIKQRGTRSVLGWVTA